MKRWTLLAWTALSCGGPDDGQSAPTPPPSASVSAARSASARPPPQGPGAGYRDEELPVAPDFEAEAERAITRDNYHQRLDELRPAASTSASTSAAAPTPLPAPPSASAR